MTMGDAAVIRDFEFLSFELTWSHISGEDWLPGWLLRYLFRPLIRQMIRRMQAVTEANKSQH